MITAKPNSKALLALLREGGTIQVPLSAFPGETILARKSHADSLRRSLNRSAKYRGLPLHARMLLRGSEWFVEVAPLPLQEAA